VDTAAPIKKNTEQTYTFLKRNRHAAGVEKDKLQTGTKQAQL